jgi:hypothetical protein
MSDARVLMGGLSLLEGWTAVRGGSMLSAALRAMWTPYPDVAPRPQVENWDVWDPGGSGPRRGGKYKQFIRLLYRGALGSLGALYGAV